jgi:hypothetical protein
MYVTVNMPATTGFKGRFGAWKARAHRAETRLCQFAECDKDATAAEGTKPLCALHKSFFVNWRPDALTPRSINAEQLFFNRRGDRR